MTEPLTKFNIPSQTAPHLLAWYDTHRRDLPWRAKPGEQIDPYAVWLSEIMLQQTTVAAVRDYFTRFLSRWPTIQALANAPLDDVLQQWAGLGYYARAHNLHKCARVIVEELGGRFPDTEEELLKLPGVGPYTAAAIASIAFDHPAVVVDGNVERVMARLFACEAKLPAGRKNLYNLAASCTPKTRPGDYAQAMMDLGATICTPYNPKCVLCPLVELCRGKDQADSLPRRSAKKSKPIRRGVVFWIQQAKTDEILLYRRPEKGLLGGMVALPGSNWQEGQFLSLKTALSTLPIPMTKARKLPGLIHHTFTHFHLELEVYTGQTRERVSPPTPYFWVKKQALSQQALPTVMKKAVALVIEGDIPPFVTG